jgi:hypothetical protein
VLLALAAACGGEAPPTLRATVVRPQQDTIRFTVPAAARGCSGGRALLLEGVDERGDGVLVRLRYGDSLSAGPVPLIALGDSVTTRGANVAVRYMKGDVAHGLALDSGAIDLTATRGALAARVRGSGLEGGGRVALEAAYTDVALPRSADTIPCRFQP